MTLMTTGWLAEGVVLIRDEDLASALYGVLAPYAGRHIALPIMRPTVYLGTTSRHLGNLAGLLGRSEEAEAHHRQALRLHAELESSVYVGYSQVELGSVLLARETPAEADEGERLISEAVATANRLGLSWLLAIAERSAVARRPPEQGMTREASMLREGDYWSVIYAGAAGRLRDGKGLGYLARLLRQPGVEIHCLDLSAERGPSGLRGDSGPVLDEKAKAAYRSRIEDLDDEIAEAQGFGDGERAARASAERDAVLEELARAVGLGGRDRRMGATSEKARVNVTRHIRGAMAKITELNPALGRHLNITVRTGQFCSYDPSAAETAVTWRLPGGPGT
jgi:hypothetical protein